MQAGAGGNVFHLSIRPWADSHLTCEDCIRLVPSHAFSTKTGIKSSNSGHVLNRVLNLMYRKSSLLFIFAALLSACSTTNSTKVDHRDFAIDTYYPASNEIQLAEHRAREYWQKNGIRFGTEPRYLAVEASSLVAAELNAAFSIKLDHSQTSGAYFTQGISSSSKQGVFGVMIFDTLTDRSVGPQGYIIVDTPSRGQVVRVADYTARYIGAGN
jgi:hypothetical protein